MATLSFVISKERNIKNGKDETLGVKEIAGALGCSTKTVRRYHARGIIPTQQLGGKSGVIKMSRVDLRNFMNKKKREKR